MTRFLISLDAGTLARVDSKVSRRGITRVEYFRALVENDLGDLAARSAVADPWVDVPLPLVAEPFEDPA